MSRSPAKRLRPSRLSCHPGCNHLRWEGDKRERIDLNKRLLFFVFLFVCLVFLAASLAGRNARAAEETAPGDTGHRSPLTPGSPLHPAAGEVRAPTRDGHTSHRSHTAALTRTGWDMYVRYMTVKNPV